MVRHRNEKDAWKKTVYLYREKQTGLKKRGAKVHVEQDTDKAHSRTVMTEMSQGARPRILVIRRDNIGDLTCTTPLIATLRERLPDAHIAALVNTYNKAVLAGNPAVDAVYAYEKGKHRGEGRSIASIYVDRLRLIMSLRKERFDYAILATPGFAQRSLRLARWIGARHVLGYAEPGKDHSRLDIALPYDRDSKAHEVERVFGLLKALGINGSPPPMRVFPDAGERHEVEKMLARLGRGTPVVGVHISARRKNQQWSAANFAALIRGIAKRHSARFLLLWAPGEADNPRHPGDDEKARAVVEGCNELPLLPCSTETLPRLIAALSLCDCVVCVDGGAMHLAAALDRPTLCFFGDSPPERWRPWKARHELLQPASQDLKDLSVEDAMAGFERLFGAHSLVPAR
jgi:heptosyltransferase-3